MNALVESEAAALAAVAESELLQILQSSLYPGASANSIRLVLGYCKAAGLDPMQKPVHIVPMWDAAEREMRDLVMPGIGLYRTIAARSGCAGVDEPEFGPDSTETIGDQRITYPLWCRVTVRRRLSTGEIAQFTAKELWKENYAAKGGPDRSREPNDMWIRRPYGQLAKCAEAQALRKGFPEIGAQPAAEEMEGKFLSEEAEVTTPRKPAVSLPQAKSGYEVAANTAMGTESPADDVLATAGEVADIFRKIKGRNMTVEAARAAARLAAGSSLEGLTKSGFCALNEALS